MQHPTWSAFDGSWPRGYLRSPLEAGLRAGGPGGEVRGILVFSALLVLVGLHTVLDQGSGIRTWLRLREELASSHARIGTLRREIAQQRREADLLQGDAFAIERAIREELGFAARGQTLVRLRGMDVSSPRFP